MRGGDKVNCNMKASNIQLIFLWDKFHFIICYSKPPLFLVSGAVFFFVFFFFLSSVLLEEVLFICEANECLQESIKMFSC